MKPLLLATLGTVVLGACAGRVPPNGQRGTLDLTGWNLEVDGPVYLDGEWEIYWNHLLDPIALEGRQALPRPVTVSIPGPWNGVEMDGRPLPGQGFATYRLDVRTGQTGGLLSIAIPWMATSYRLYVDGGLVAANGRVGDSPESALPQFRPTVGTFAPAGETITLVAQVANFRFREGGIRNRLELGTAAQMADRVARRLALAMIVLGGILIMGIYHVGLYAFRRDDSSTLWFGAFCLVIAAKFVVAEEHPLTRAWPDFPWNLQLRIEYLANAMSAPFFYMFLAGVYPADVPRFMLRFSQVSGALFAIVVLCFPVRVSSWLMPPYQLFLAFFAVYGAIVFVQAVRRRREGADLLLVGGGILTLAVLNDLLSYSQIVLTPRMTPVGLFIMIGTQSVLLAQRFSEAFRRQTVLADENAQLLGGLRASMDELRSSRRLLTAREEGLRKQIAEMLHGRVQTRLLVAWQWLGQAAGLIDRDAARARTLVMTARDEIQRIQEEDVRRVSHLLHPSIVDVGLVPAARSLTDRFADTLRVTLDVHPRLAALDADPEGGIPTAVRLAAYRVLEEALGNVVAHAGASQVRVTLGFQEAGQLLLRVEDDGRGPDPARMEHGLGLRTIADRVADLDGRWALTSAPGSGAILTATLPLPDGMT